MTTDVPLVHGVPKKRLGEAPTIDPTCVVQQSVIGAWTSLGPHTTIVESSFGDYSYTADNVSILYSTVGKFCSIASHVRLNPGNHAMWRVTQHHATYRRAEHGFADTDDEEFFDWQRAHAVAVGHDVWIGHGATIMPGVTVGTGAVIGAGAVVTKDVVKSQLPVGKGPEIRAASPTVLLGEVEQIVQGHIGAGDVAKAAVRVVEQDETGRGWQERGITGRRTGLWEDPWQGAQHHPFVRAWRDNEAVPREQRLHRHGRIHRLHDARNRRFQ